MKHLGTLRRDATYGLGVHVISLDSEDADNGVDTDELKERLLELFRSPSYRPPLLPAVAVELLALTRMPEVRVSEVVRLLGHDAVLAGQVLNVARSAAYARGEPLRSLEEAIVRLGLSRIADIFLRVSLEAKVFRAAGYAEPMARLRRHSAFVAEGARLVSQATCGLDDHAFLCGLLHDVGIAACILALSGPLRDRVEGDFERAWPTVRAIHASCSELLAKVWGLPPDVSLVLGLHHQPESDGRVHPLAAATRFADCFSEHVDRGFMSDAEPELLPQCALQLGLNRATRDKLEGALRKLANDLGD